jgi:hypothetical protein
MAFGQPSGPPASHKQIALLQSLLAAIGHDDFRTARHEFGLTQRQAGGKFSVQEAAALIERLEGSEPAEPAEPQAPPTVQRREVAQRPRTTTLRDMPADQLATELERRGWIVIPPA